MKKILFALFVMTMLIACKGEDGIDGTNGVGTNWYNNAYTIKSNEWILAGKPNEVNSFYYADIKIPQLTSEVFNNGAVILYLDKGGNTKNVMPYVLHSGEIINGYMKTWTQTYDYEIEPGWIRVYVTFSDFKTSLSPDKEKVHVVMVW